MGLTSKKTGVIFLHFGQNKTKILKESMLKKLIIGLCVALSVPATASALQYWELFTPQVLGTSTYASVTLVNNRSLVLSVMPLDFQNNAWSYQVS